MRPLATLAALLFGLGACAAIEPPAASTPAAPTPAPAAAAQPALPPVALAPRSQWKRITIDPRSGFAEAWLASAPVPLPEGHMRRWVAANLRDSIPMPETGGRAASVAFLADYHCDKHAWQPVEAVWFAQRNQRQEVLRERPRGPGEREVAHGTLVDVFLDAACKDAAPRQQRRR